MGKIFLSHSSADKGYVKYIAERFGKDRCVYDAMCFDAGLKNLDEIYREMDNSSIFVVFISNNSLESDWVNKELSAAEERLNHDTYKLSQIFPIIIDRKITHRDSRIPNFLKKGFNSYNLRFIESPQVAYRKIAAQQTRFQMESGTFRPDTCFYGRDAEMQKFREAFDSGAPIKCAIASGLSGIGRRSYLIQCLKSSHIIENYYMPPSITLHNMESIEDLIVKISQIGYGQYALEDIASLPSMESKIDILSNLLAAIQDNKEVLFIYDENCIVDRYREIAYWFDKALSRIRPEITVLIAARTSVSYTIVRRNPAYFAIDISTLPKNEWSGLMRVYADQSGIELSRADCTYFSDILTGYPPQVLFTVDLIKQSSLDEVKSKPHILVDYFSPKVSSMLEAIIPSELKSDAYGLLAFFSSYGIVPNDLLYLVITIKEEYNLAYQQFRSLTIARNVGSSGEYTEISPLVSDYIQRTRYRLPDDIRVVLNSRLEEIGQVVKSGENTVAEDFEELKFYLISNIVNGEDIPDKFMYSTLYLSSVYDLYNRQKYAQVISLVAKLKEMGAFERYDAPIRERIQGYYCRSLAREGRDAFYTEVEFFNHPRTDEEYNFLRGFMYRHESKYGKALECYKKVLKKHPEHRSAMREIVTVYRGLEDYESSYLYARDNYIHDPENPYQIQPFFEILVRKDSSQRTQEENSLIKEMLSTIGKITQIRPSSTYYEMNAQYATYVEADKDKAIAILNVGIKENPDSSYLVRNLFDCYEFFKDINGMEYALSEFEQFKSNSKSVKVAFLIRQALLSAHQGKPRDYVYNSITNINGIDDDAKGRLKRRAASIFSTSLTLCY